MEMFSRTVQCVQYSSCSVSTDCVRQPIAALTVSWEVRRGAGHYVQDWENTRGISYHAYPNARRVLFFLARHRLREYIRLLFTTFYTAVIS